MRVRIVRLYAYKQIDSTNLQAQRLWDQPPTQRHLQPFAVRADHQTAGIGRAGRTWLSPPHGLWMSILWPMRQNPAHYQPAPLLVGLATAEAIQAATGLVCQIKWPNDLLVHGRKLAGILCQAEIPADPPTTNAIIAGIGINGNFPIQSLGQGLRHPPTTLQHELAHPVDLDALCLAVCQRTQERLEQFEHAGLAPALEPLQRRLAWLGQQVQLTDTDGTLHAAGRLAGLNDHGHILIDNGSTTQALAIGEMHLAPQPAEAATT